MIPSFSFPSPREEGGSGSGGHVAVDQPSYVYSFSSAFMDSYMAGHLVGNASGGGMWSISSPLRVPQRRESEGRHGSPRTTVTTAVPLYPTASAVLTTPVSPGSFSSLAPLPGVPPPPASAATLSSPFLEPSAGEDPTPTRRLLLLRVPAIQLLCRLAQKQVLTAPRSPLGGGGGGATSPPPPSVGVLQKRSTTRKSVPHPSSSAAGGGGMASSATPTTTTTREDNGDPHGSPLLLTPVVSLPRPVPPSPFRSSSSSRRGTSTVPPPPTLPHSSSASSLPATSSRLPGETSASSFSCFSSPPPPSSSPVWCLTLHQCTAILSLMAIALECRQRVLKGGEGGEGRVERGEACPSSPLQRQRRGHGGSLACSTRVPSGASRVLEDRKSHRYRSKQRKSVPPPIRTSVTPGSRGEGGTPRPPSHGSFSSLGWYSTPSPSLSPLLSPASVESFFHACSAFFTTLLPQLPYAQFAEEVNVEEFCASLVACGVLMRLDEEDDDEDPHLLEEEVEEGGKGEGETEPAGMEGDGLPRASRRHHRHRSSGESGKSNGNAEKIAPVPHAGAAPPQDSEKATLPASAGHRSSTAPPASSLRLHGFSSWSSFFIPTPHSPHHTTTATSVPHHPSAAKGSSPYVRILHHTFSGRVVDPAIIACLPLTLEEMVENPVAKGTLRGLSIARRSISWSAALAKRIRDLTVDGVKKSVLDREGNASPPSSTSSGGYFFASPSYQPSSSSSSSSFFASPSFAPSSFMQKREILLLLLEAMSKARNTKVLLYTTPWMMKILQEESYIINGLCKPSLLHSRVVGAALVLLRRHYQHMTSRLIAHHQRTPGNSLLCVSPSFGHYSSSSFSASPEESERGEQSTSAVGTGRLGSGGKGGGRWMSTTGGGEGHASQLHPSPTMLLSSPPSSEEFGSPFLDLQTADNVLNGVWRTLQYAEHFLPSRPGYGSTGAAGGSPAGAGRGACLYGANLQLVMFHLLSVEVERLRCSIALCKAEVLSPRAPFLSANSSSVAGGGDGGFSGPLTTCLSASFSSCSSPALQAGGPSGSSPSFHYGSGGAAAGCTGVDPFSPSLSDEVSPKEESLRIGVISQILKFIILPTSIFAAVPSGTPCLPSPSEGKATSRGPMGAKEETVSDTVWDRICEMVSRVTAMFTAPVDMTLPLPSTDTHFSTTARGRRRGSGSSMTEVPHTFSSTIGPRAFRRRRSDPTYPVGHEGGWVWRRKFTNQYYRNLEGMAHLLFDQMIRDGGGIPDGTDVGFAFLFAKGREVKEKEKETAAEEEAASGTPPILKSAAVRCLMGIAESDPHIRSFVLSLLFDFAAKACTQCELYVLHPEESLTIQASQLVFHTLCAILVPRGCSESLRPGLRITTCGTMENVERYAKLVTTSYTSILRAELQKPGAHLQKMVLEKYLPTAGMVAVAELYFMLVKRVLQRMLDLITYGKQASYSAKRWHRVSKETLDMAKILLTHLQACVLAVAWPDSGVLYHPSVAFDACFSSSSSSSVHPPGNLLASAAIQSISPLLLSLSVLLHLVPPVQSSFDANSSCGSGGTSATASSAGNRREGNHVTGGVHSSNGKEEGISVEELAYRTGKCVKVILKEGKDAARFTCYLSDQLDFHTTTNCCTPLFRSVWLLFTMYGIAEDAVALMRPRFLTNALHPVFQTGLNVSQVAKVVACATSAPPLLLMNSASLQQVVTDIDILLRQLAKNELDGKQYQAYHVTLLPFSSSFSSPSIQGRLAESKVRKQLIKGFLRVCPKSGKSLAQLRTRELFLLKAVLQLELTRVGAGYFSTIPLYQHFNVREFVASPAIPKVLQQITEYLSVQLTAVINYCFTPDYSMKRLEVGIRRLLLYATFGVRSVRVSSITFVRHALRASPMQMIQSGGLPILWQLIDLVEEANPVEMQDFCRRMKYLGDPSLPSEHHSAERMEELLALQELAKEWVEVGRRRAPQDLIHLATQFITSGFGEGVSVENVHLGTRLAILAGQINAEGPMEAAQKKGKPGERGTSSLVMKFSRAYGSVIGALSFLTPLQLEEKVILRLAALLHEGRQLLHPLWKGREKSFPSKTITAGGRRGSLSDMREAARLSADSHQKQMWCFSSLASSLFQSTNTTGDSFQPGTFFSRFESELYAASFMLRTQPIRFKTHRLLVLYVSQAPIKLFSAKAIRIASECWSWLIVREESTLVIPILKGIVEAVQWTIGEKLGLFDGDQTRQSDVVQTGEDTRVRPDRDRDALNRDVDHPETPHYAIFKFLVDNYLRHDSSLTQSSHVLTLLYILASSILQDPEAISLKDESFLETMQAMVLVGKIVHEVFVANIRRLRGNQPLIIPFTSLGMLRQRWWKALLHWFRKFPASWYFGSDPSSMTCTAIATLESLLLLLRTEKQTLRQNTIGFLDFSTNVRTQGKTIGMIPSMHRRELLPKGVVTTKERMASLVEVEQQRMTQCLELLSLLVDHELLRLRVWERPRRTLELTNTMEPYAKSALACLDAAVAHDPMVAVTMVRRLSPMFKKLSARLTQHVIARPELFAHIPEAADYYLTASVVARGAPKLFLFANASIIQALRLLDERYSHCESITSYAIRSLRSKNSNHLIFYLPQLLQVLGSDSSGRIAEFLSQMSTGNTMFCHQLLWALRTEGEGGEGDGKPSSSSRLASRCRALTASILQRLSPEQLDFYEHVFGYMDMVISLSGDLMEFEKLQRKPQLRQWLKNEKYHIPPKKYHLYLPTNPDFRITGVIPHTASAMQSAAKCPIFIQFEGVERGLEDMESPKSSSSSALKSGKTGSGGGSVVPVKKACIFKMGDDCRQDQLALQLIELFKRIFQTVGVPFFLYPYRVVTTGQTSGIIECVPQSLSRNEIGKLVESNLAEYFVQSFGHPETGRFRRARENFVKSVAAYSIVTFVLNIKDRHNGNIMVDANGNLIHIDFGFLFDTSPGGDLNFESSPFKLTTEMIQLIGRDVGSRSTLKSDALQKALIDEENYIYFKVLANRCFLAVRQYAHEICILVELMLRSGLPCFKPQQTIANLAERLCIDESEITAAHFMRQRIHTARENIRTKLYDHFQRIVEGIEM